MLGAYNIGALYRTPNGPSEIQHGGYIVNVILRLSVCLATLSLGKCLSGASATPFAFALQSGDNSRNFAMIMGL
jgi:hypothetical protein